MSTMTRVVVLVLAVENVVYWLWVGGTLQGIFMMLSLLVLVLTGNTKTAVSTIDAPTGTHVNGQRPRFDRKTNQLLSSSGLQLGANSAVDLDAEIAKQKARIQTDKRRRARAEA